MSFLQFHNKINENLKFNDFEFENTWRMIESYLKDAKNRLASGHNLDGIFYRLAQSVRNELLDLEHNSGKR